MDQGGHQERKGRWCFNTRPRPFLCRVVPFPVLLASRGMRLPVDPLHFLCFHQTVPLSSTLSSVLPPICFSAECFDCWSRPLRPQTPSGHFAHSHLSFLFLPPLTRSKISLGSKALSHDSVFVSDSSEANEALGASQDSIHGKVKSLQVTWPRGVCGDGHILENTSA